MIVDVSEMRGLAADLHGAARTIDPLVRAATTKTLIDIESGAKVIAPVDTGAHRASIGHDVDDDGYGGIAYAGMVYSPYLEFGTSRMPPQPSLGPSFDQNIPDWLDALDIIIGQPIGRS